jgi:Ca2+-binding RTX toxin-like protein
MNTSDQAQLTVYRGANQVGQSEVNVNANGLVDQSVAFSGRVFNRAVFRYVDAAGSWKNAYEVIDDIKVSPICTIAGNDGNNVLHGTWHRDVICGDSGNDTIHGFGGNDLIYPGSGRDHSYGGAGHDTVLDNLGWDHVNGGAGNDDVRGGLGRDTITGGYGNDHLNGGLGRDYCNGGSGYDQSQACEVRRRIP